MGDTNFAADETGSYPPRPRPASQAVMSHAHNSDQTDPCRNFESSVLSCFRETCAEDNNRALHHDDLDDEGCCTEQRMTGLPIASRLCSGAITERKRGDEVGSGI
jgi:hypothetical protein